MIRFTTECMQVQQLMDNFALALVKFLLSYIYLILSWWRCCSIVDQVTNRHDLPVNSTP